MKGVRGRQAGPFTGRLAGLRRPPPAKARAAELHAAAEAVALCNSPAGIERQLWIVLCDLRDSTVSWVETLAALRERMSPALELC